MKNKSRRYVLFVFKGKFGHGLLSVFAKSKESAREVGKQIIGKRKFTVGEVWTFQKYFKGVKWFAVNDYISRNTKLKYGLRS